MRLITASDLKAMSNSEGEALSKRLSDESAAEQAAFTQYNCFNNERITALVCSYLLYLPPIPHPFLQDFRLPQTAMPYDAPPGRRFFTHQPQVGSVLTLEQRATSSQSDASGYITEGQFYLPEDSYESLADKRSPEIVETPLTLAVERAVLFHCPIKDLRIASILVSYLEPSRLTNRILAVLDATSSMGDSVFVTGPTGAIHRMIRERIYVPSSFMPMSNLHFETFPQRQEFATVPTTSTRSDLIKCARLCDELISIDSYTEQLNGRRQQASQSTTRAQNNPCPEELIANPKPDSTEMIATRSKTPESLELHGITVTTKIDF